MDTFSDLKLKFCLLCSGFEGVLGLFGGGILER